MALLASSFFRWTGRNLTGNVDIKEARAVFETAPFALVSHGTEADPVFNYGNSTALGLFEMTWDEFTRLPSRLSAEPVRRDERKRLMEEVAQKGYIADFQGIRVSKNGRRFFIENGIVWNVVDDAGIYRGQAAMFVLWRLLDNEHAQEEPS